MNNMKLSKDEIEKIANAVAKKIEKEKSQQEKQKRDWRLRNTKLLLKNYRMLEEHCEGVEAELSTYEEIVYDPEELNLHSLMKYKAKTSKMLIYFNDMVDAYGRYCEREGEAAKRRHGVINRLYVADKALMPNRVAELYNVNLRTIYKDVDKAIEELSVFLFGIDSIQDLMEGHKLGNTRA